VRVAPTVDDTNFIVIHVKHFPLRQLIFHFLCIHVSRYSNNAIYSPQILKRINILEVSCVDDEINLRELLKEFFGQLLHLLRNMGIGNNAYSRFE
jgi:hypothetical protein